MIKIRFLGATKQVTGSMFLVTAGHEKILVDCGLFQGGKDVYMRNYDEFRFDTHDIQHVILTHAHNDHCGRLPLMSKRGFRGIVHAHSATVDLARIIMLDSAFIQEVEAGWRTKKNRRRGQPRVEPLYTVPDAEKTLKLFKKYRYNTPVKISDRFSFTFHDAGHILGSCILELDVKNNDGSTIKLVFSGDLGRNGQPLIKDPEILDKADYLIIESTYGARIHKEIEATKDELAWILQEAAVNNGNVIIPAFAVGRTQEIIYFIRQLYEEGRVPKPYKNIYVDSPMATEATAVYEHAISECYGEETLEMFRNNVSPIRFEGLRFVSSVEESMLLNMRTEGQIIISASGMCDAGRVLHHLRHNLWNENSHVVITGFQAEGTKGRKLVDGQPVVKIMREEILVKAKIHTINALSAHADSAGLTDWASHFSPAPRLTMIVHGEPAQAAGVKQKLSSQLGFKCTIPEYGEEIALW